VSAGRHGGPTCSNLFYRTNVFPVQVPSLRERVDDIPLLVRYFAQVDRKFKSPSLIGSRAL
jgi:transcriptional regulator with GAF, ATPase, and Fis domain